MKTPETMKITKRQRILPALLLVLVMSLVLPVRAQAAPADTTLTEHIAALQATQTVQALAAPQAGSRMVKTLDAGSVVVTTGATANGYWKVIVDAGSYGYIPGPYMQEIPVGPEMIAAFREQAAVVDRAIALAGGGQAGAAQAAAANTAAQAAGAATAQAVPAGLSPAPAPTAGNNVIFVGDSRTGDMCKAVGGTQAHPGVYFFYIYGGRYEHFSTTELPKIDALVGRGSIVIINYGVNDLENGYNYSQLINGAAAAWAERGALTFYASVAPMYGEMEDKSNERIDNFNRYMNNNLSASVGRIDLNGFMKQYGYRMVDQLHYDAPTSQNNFNFLMQSVGK